MNIFDRFRAQPRPINDAAHLERYLDSTNGRNVRGEITIASLATVLDMDGEVAYEEDGAYTRRGDFVKVPREDSGEPDKILFIDEDMSDVLQTGRPTAILVASEGRLLVDAASLAVRTRQVIPAQRSGESL